MKPTIALLLLVSCAFAAEAHAAPAWGGNCLSCHNQPHPQAIAVFGEDGIADPDESGTGAPDRGPLPVFEVDPGQTAHLMAAVQGLDTDDTYAITLRRLQFPGVESNGQLLFAPDCSWAEWGENASYYSDPAVGYYWDEGPTVLEFDLTAVAGSGGDYYDLVLAVAGKYHDDGQLFYAEEHFYLHVVTVPGDLNSDGTINATDLALLLGDWGPCPGCLADLDGNGVVNASDLAILLGNWS